MISKRGIAYRVEITRRAERDLRSLYETINAKSSDRALESYRGPKQAILSLEEQPDRCPRTPEDRGLRHLLYGRKPHVFRVIYRVVAKAKRVEVLHIRHGASRKFRASDVA